MSLEKCSVIQSSEQKVKISISVKKKFQNISGKAFFDALKITLIYIYASAKETGKLPFLLSAAKNS
jgi:hypothetical protein